MPTTGSRHRPEVGFPPHQPMAETLYDWLAAHGRGEPLDVHVLASVIALRCAEVRETAWPPLGLPGTELQALLTTHFPHALAAWKPSKVPIDAVTGQDAAAPEDELRDLRALLLEHTDPHCPTSTWLAAIIAHAALRPNHLWEDLGLRNRSEVSALMGRHFSTLAARNAGSLMRWKKFFYKQLCERAEVQLCRAPNCQVCDEYTVCFSVEQTTMDRSSGIEWRRAEGP